MRIPNGCKKGTTPTQLLSDGFRRECLAKLKTPHDFVLYGRVKVFETLLIAVLPQVIQPDARTSAVDRH